MEKHKFMRKLNVHISSKTSSRISELEPDTSWQGWRIAAIILAFVCIGSVMLFMLKAKPSHVSYSIITTPLGQRSVVQLSDGSKVWLNAGSKLKYPDQFNGKLREVFLEGEAFFNVAKNTQVPFIVYTSDINIRVLGTEFNVKSYPDEGIIETTLVSGAVDIESPDKNETLFKLKPNQKAVYKKKRLPEREVSITEKTSDSFDDLPKVAPLKTDFKIHDTNVEAETAWTEGVMVIRRETFETLAVKLERKYDLDFVFIDSTLKDFRISGTIKDVSIEQVLDGLKLTAPITYKLKDKTVMIYENKASRANYEQLQKIK
jgi:ferric-dicitrate binding protein FerR (iron transport regulator)